jgi:membrane-associated protease RseP (regulator of RpoE activity)
MTDPKTRKRHLIQAALFAVTVITTTLAGAELMYGKYLLFSEGGISIEEFFGGFQYSFAFLLFLTVHEFGHYITARLYQIRVTLPYYIPLYFFGVGLSIGSMGAIIKIEGIIHSRKQFFDIGIAGPLAGFVVAIGLLWYGFTHLPPPEFIFQIHPEYAEYGLDYAEHVYTDQTFGFTVGTNLIYSFFVNFVAPDPSWVPNPYEIMHYPWIFAGYLALFFTSLNLLPIGQLDGGHILYGILGSARHRVISASLFIAFIFYAGLGLVTPHDSPDDLTWSIRL